MFYSMNILSGFALAALVALAAAMPVEIVNSTLSDKRAGICRGTKQKQTIKVGNGNPHQNFAYKQVSPNTFCTNNPGGSAAVTTELSVGFSVSIAAEVEFITGGFDVSVSTSTGFTNSFGCATVVDGVSGTQTGSLCVYERIQLTAFTVNTQVCVENMCQDETCVKDTGPNSIIYAPNAAQGGCFYDNFQLNLPCGIMGDVKYVYDGPAGGPQFIPC